MCLNYKLEEGCVLGDNCHFRHVEPEGEPNKKWKKGGAKGSVAILKGSLQLGVVYLKILIRENRFHVNLENWEQNAPSNSPRAPGTKSKIRERKGPSRGIIQKGAPHERSPCAPKFGE